MAPAYELALFVAPKSVPCVVARDQATAAAEQLRLPFSLYDASLPAHDRLVTGFNISELPTLLLLRQGRMVHAFESPGDFKTASLVARLTKLMAKAGTHD